MAEINYEGDEAGSPLQPARISHPIFRTIRRGLLPHFSFKGMKDKGKEETTKPVIQTSLSIALARCCVHILPVLTSITIISLNLGHLYLGRTIPGIILDNNITIAIFQVLAKLQELLILASLSTIIFHVIRDGLISGNGVPLGFLGSGFMFSEVSYFWSSDFWGAFRARIPFRAKCYLAVLLLASGLIAATAGPSSAVLLIPRIQDWNAGGSEFYLRGLADDLFPSQMAVSSASLNPLCANSQAINYAVCPSGGFPSLWTYSSNLPTIRNSANLQPRPISIFGLYAGHDVNIASTLGTVPDSTLKGNIRGLACQTSVVAPYVPAIMYQSQLSRDWWSISGDIPWDITNVWTASTAEYRYNSGKTLSTATRIPAVRVACSEGHNVSMESREISFPVLPQYACWNAVKPHKSLQLNNTPTDHIRTTWTPLPSEYGAVSTGLIFEAPWTKERTSRVVVGCSIDARWADGIVDGSAGRLTDTASPELWGRVSELNTPFRPPFNSSWSQITLDKSWLEILTPSTLAQSHGNNTWNITTLESLLANSAIIDDNLTNSRDQTATWDNMELGASNRTLYLEWIISLLVADGISRQESIKALNTSGPVYEWSLLDYNKRPEFQSQLLHSGQALYEPLISNVTSFTMSITIQGFSYQAQSTTDFLSIAVLLAHILLALGHTIYLMIKRQSSRCWGTITELLALAQNSRPAPSALKNTSTGIRCIGTFAKVAKVRVTGDNGLDDGEDRLPANHVELIFCEDKDTREDGVWSESDGDDTGQIYTAATWPMMSEQAAVTALDIGHQSRVSVGSSQPLLLRQLKFNGRPGQGSLNRAQREIPMDEPERVQADRHYG